MEYTVHVVKFETKVELETALQAIPIREESLSQGS